MDGILIAQEGREFQVKMGTTHLLLLSLLSPTLLFTFDSWPASLGNVREKPIPQPHPSPTASVGCSSLGLGQPSSWPHTHLSLGTTAAARLARTAYVSLFSATNNTMPQTV